MFHKEVVPKTALKSWETVTGVMGSYVSCYGYLLRVTLEALEEVYKLSCSGDGK